MENLTFPQNFYDIGQKTFLWVWQNRKEFVDFTLKDMKEATGLFKKWVDYCCLKSKQETDGTS